VAKPAPKGGLVIRYDYLWVSEEARGREEGAKTRPCAVVVALPGTDPIRVIVCGITHRPPDRGDDGIALPLAVKRYLGLDDEPSWVITSEVNIVDWEDPGIIPVEPGSWEYGYLPPSLAEQVRGKVLAHSKRKKLSAVDRPKIEKRRTARQAREN